MDTKIILKRLGFVEVHTGGGCTALQKCFNDGTSILITNNGGATIEEMDDGLIVGFENADGEAELQIMVENPKDIIKLVEVEKENRFTKGLDMILNSKFRVYNFKNYDTTPDLGKRGSDRSGWTGSLWRLGHTAHIARIDNDGSVIKFCWMEEKLRGNGKEDFEKFCKSLPPYTNREWLEHYLGEDSNYVKGLPNEDENRGRNIEYIFSEEKVVDILALKEDQIQKEANETR